MVQEVGALVCCCGSFNGEPCHSSGSKKRSGLKKSEGACDDLDHNCAFGDTAAYGNCSTVVMVHLF